MNLHPGIILIAIAGTVFTLGIIAGLIIIPMIGSLELIIRFTIQQLAQSSSPTAIEKGKLKKS